MEGLNCFNIFKGYTLEYFSQNGLFSYIIDLKDCLCLYNESCFFISYVQNVL